MNKPIKVYIKTTEIIEENDGIPATLESFNATFKITLNGSIFSFEELRGIIYVLERAKKCAEDFYKEYGYERYPNETSRRN